MSDVSQPNIFCKKVQYFTLPQYTLTARIVTGWIRRRAKAISSCLPPQLHGDNQGKGDINTGTIQETYICNQCYRINNHKSP